MKRFKITEEQYKAFNESIRLNETEKENPKLSVTADSNNPEQVQKATEKAKNATNKLGEPVDIKLNNKNNGTQFVNCSRIITKKQIKAAGCILPVSHDLDIPKELGLRHRAALGISQESDAIAIVVSEETGAISVALRGQFQLRLSAEELESFLTQNLE